MSVKKIFMGLFLFASFWDNLLPVLRSNSGPRINSGTNSRITVNKGSYIRNSSSNMNIGKASLTVTSGAIAEGLPIAVAGGGVSLNNGATTMFTGAYNPSNATVSVVSSSWRGMSGATGASVALSNGASLEGISDLSNPVSIESGAVANIGLQSSANSNISIDSSTANLTSDLNFSGSSQLVGDGTVVGNGNAAILGGSDLIITSSVKWVNADIIINSKIDFYGQWTFLNDIHLIGNGNLLDVTHGGKMYIKDNTTVYISNLNIKGLVPSQLIFEGANSKLVLSSSSLGFSSDYTLTIGRMTVDSPSSFVVGDKIVTFGGTSYLTVDGVSLFYDPLTFLPNHNIRPVPADDPLQTYVKYVNNGRIVSYADGELVVNNSNAINYWSPINRTTSNAVTWIGEKVRTDSNAFAYGIKNNSNTITMLDAELQTIDHGPGDIEVHSLTYTLSYDLFLSDEHSMRFENSCVLDGAGHSIHFAKGNFGCLFIGDSCNVTFMNVVLKDFYDTVYNLGTDASLVFDKSTLIELGGNQSVSRHWSFNGSVIVNGLGSELSMSSGDIELHGGSLYLQNLTLSNLYDNNLRCKGNGIIYLSNDTLNVLDSNTFSFTWGAMVVDQTVKLKGIFSYSSPFGVLIGSNSKLVLEPMTPSYPYSAFIYSPITADRDLFQMQDYTSELHLNGCTLVSTTTGMRLTKGTLFIDGKSTISSLGASSLSESICFGNGNDSDDLFVNIQPGASLNVSGLLDIQNVN